MTRSMSFASASGGPSTRLNFPEERYRKLKDRAAPCRQPRDVRHFLSRWWGRRPGALKGHQHRSFKLALEAAPRAKASPARALPLVSDQVPDFAGATCAPSHMHAAVCLITPCVPAVSSASR